MVFAINCLFLKTNGDDKFEVLDVVFSNFYAMFRHSLFKQSIYQFTWHQMPLVIKQCKRTFILQ